MRNFATVGKLKVQVGLEITIRNLRKVMYTKEEKLARVTAQVKELWLQYCNTP